MVARVQRDHRLVVEFNREGEEPDRLHVRTGEEAMLAALRLLAMRQALLIGDALTVRADDAEPRLPEVSRSSHYS